MRLDQQPAMAPFRGSGFPDARKWLLQNLSNQSNDPKSLRTVVFNPPGQIVESSGFKAQAFQSRPRTG
jgi:hypothetical protein